MMALQLGALRDALLDAGAKPETADRAAEELAWLQEQRASPRIDTEALIMLTLMVAGLYAVGAPVVWLLIRVASKVGAL